MKKSIKAQSIIEYVTIVTLVISGILLMGPYLVRAINSHFQSMESDAIDSITEVIHQAPVNSFGGNLPPCDCEDLAPQDCGDNIFCPCGTREWTRTCAPLGCETDLPVTITMKECRVDSTCDAQNGGWADWEPWSCDTTCGTGTETHFQYCTNPVPYPSLNCALDCSPPGGVNSETRPCTSYLTCPQEGCDIPGGERYKC